MRLNASPENLLERIALRAGVVPTPLGDTIVVNPTIKRLMLALGAYCSLDNTGNTHRKYLHL